jgi:hypothetical protein
MISSAYAEFEENHPTIPFDINFVEPPIEWLVDQWLMRNRLNFITGDPKAGKSRLFRYMLIRVFAQRPVIELLKVGPRPHRILWLATEERPGEIMADLIKLARIEGFSLEEIQATFPDWLHFKNLTGFNMERTKEQAYIKSVVEQGYYDTVIVDPLRGVFSGDENKSEIVKPLLDGFRNLVNKNNVTLIVIHHSKKPGDNPLIAGPSDVLRGSGHIAGSADHVLFVERRVNGDIDKKIPGEMTIEPMGRRAPHGKIDLWDGHDEDFAFRFQASRKK